MPPGLLIGLEILQVYWGFVAISEWFSVISPAKGSILVNSMIIIIAMRREAQAVAWWDAALPIALGFGATLIEIAVIVVLRWQFSLALPLQAYVGRAMNT
jgi:hypothetical protein